MGEGGAQRKHAFVYTEDFEGCLLGRPIRRESDGLSLVFNGHAEVGGTGCVRVLRGGVEEIYLSPEHSFAILRRALRAKESEDVLVDFRCRDHCEGSPDLWLPMQIERIIGAAMERM